MNIQKTKWYYGTSGFFYWQWKRVFYPTELSPSQWLSFYAKHFNAIEINSSFYRVPSKSNLKKWSQQTPKHFVFIFKLPKSITHLQQWKDWDSFLSVIEVLQEKCPCFLAQFPPSMKALPHHIEFITTLLEKSPLPLALEFRHPSWNEHHQALCNMKAIWVYADSKNQSISSILPASFLYFRLHGKNSHHDLYSEDFLISFLQLIQQQSQKTHTVFLFFNNTGGGSAPLNALMWKKLLQASSITP